MDLVGEFIEKKVPVFDDGWAWNKALGRVQAERPMPSESIKSRTTQFGNRMQAFLANDADHETKTAFLNARTWDDIQKEAAEAVEKHNKDGHTWRQPFSKSRRAFGKVACRLEFLIELLPKGDYTSIISGGLKLVFNAAKRIKVLRATILRTFDSLGDNIDNTKAYIRIYSQDEELQKRVEDLYVAILEAVEAIVTWLENSPLKESFKSFFQQSQYGQAVTDKITTNIQDKADAFDNRVRACLHSTVQEVNKGVVKVGKQVTELRGQLRNGLQDLKEDFAVGIREEFERKSTIENVLIDLVKGCEWIREMQELSMQKQSLLQTQVEQISLQPQVQVIVRYVPQPLLTIEKLLELLQDCPGQSPGEWSIPDIARRDEEFVLSLANELDPSQQERLAVITQEPKFKSWFKSSLSSILIANSLTTSPDYDSPLSSMSYMCGLLSRTLSQLGFQTPLAFYCGLHSTPGAVLLGTNGLLRSLIAQLLVNYNATVHISFLNCLEEVQAIQRHDLRALCRLFRNLMACLDSAVVFCLIDGVSWFETTSWREDLDVAMGFLNTLTAEVADSGSRLTVKLLVTSSVTSWGCREWFPGVDEVFLPEDDCVDAQGLAPDDSSLHFATLY